MTKKLLALLVGAGLLVVGLVLTFLPHSAAGNDCGSVFSKSQQPYMDDLLDGHEGVSAGPGPREAACDERLAAYRTPTYTLLAVGAPIFLAGLGWFDGLARLVRRGEKNTSGGLSGVSGSR